MISESELASAPEPVQKAYVRMSERAERLELEVKYLREMLRRERIAK